MAAKVHGTAYVFGIGATDPTAGLIQNISVSKSDANVDEVTDHTGLTVTVRSDSQRDELSFDLRITSSYTALAPGDKVTIVDSGTPSTAGEYMVKTAVLTCKTKDFYTYAVTATKYEGLTLS